MLTAVKDAVKEVVKLFVPGQAQVTFLKIPAGWVCAAAGFVAKSFLG